MNPEVRTMYENLFETFKAKFKDPLESWDRFLEFIAIDNYFPVIAEFEYTLSWFIKNNSFLEAISNIYDPNLSKSDLYDHLGELYFANILSNNPSQVSKNPSYYPSVVKKHMTKTSENNKVTIFDPFVGSGKRIMEIYKTNPNAILFGIESDLRLYRIALTNCFIHNIPAYLLHADNSKHEYDISTKEGKYNWQYYNKWHSCMNKLLPKIKCKNNSTNDS